MSFGAKIGEISEPTYSIVQSTTQPLNTRSEQGIALINRRSENSRSEESSSLVVENFSIQAHPNSSGSYGAVEDSSAVSDDSSSVFYANSYQPEGTLYRISSTDPRRIFKKELRDFVTSASCCFQKDYTATALESASPSDALLKLEDYSQEHSPLLNAELSDFPALLFHLYRLQGILASADFRKQVEPIIKKALDLKEQLKKSLEESSSEAESSSFIHDESSVEQTAILQNNVETALLKKQIACLNAFIAYELKALSVDEYLERYNQLHFYLKKMPKKEQQELLAQFEEATIQLHRSLKRSKNASKALLECISETEQNKIARDLFQKIAEQDENEENPFEVVLCPGGGDLTPTTHANKWTCERLKKDLFLSLEKEALPSTP